jgi:hypothetical protein
VDIDELLAREQIRDALARYARGVDRLDLDLALSAFHLDAVDHHGKSVGNPRGTLPEIFQRLRTHLADSHFLCSSSITLHSPTAAAVETYAVGFHRLAGDAGPLDLQIGLRYVDRFECRDGDWRITERHVIEDWRRADSVGAGTPPGAFEAGVRGPADRSYVIGGSDRPRSPDA